MSQKLPTPTDAADLTRELAQLIDADLESGDHATGEEAIIVVKFKGVIAPLWWLEATSVLTTMFASRDVFLTFIFKRVHLGAKGVTIRYLTP